MLSISLGNDLKNKKRGGDLFRSIWLHSKQLYFQLLDMKIVKEEKVKLFVLI